MRVDKAVDVRLGARPVARLALGAETVWPVRSGEAYLEISPNVIWLLRANGWTDYVQVLSNVEWRVE